MSKEFYIKSFFLDHFFREKNLPLPYSQVTNKLTNQILPNDFGKLNKHSYDLISIYDIPDYLIPNIYKDKKNKLLKTKLYSGYLIDLNAYEDLESYLNNKLGRSRKSQIKRYKKRLDLCLDVTYKIYYGAIDKDEYLKIFKALKEITKLRFEEKQEVNFEIPFLDLYEETMFDLVLKKKAAIFVIYDNNRPINITLNLIKGTSLWHWNSCYDIDYSVFNLGHINMLNHLKWSFENNIKVFDMGRGDFLHKRKYVNLEYQYEQHILYNPKDIVLSFIALKDHYTIALRTYIIRFLKYFKFQNVYAFYSKTKYKLFNKKNEELCTIQVEKIANLPENTPLKEVNNDEITGEIKRLFNFFLHRSKMSNSKIKILRNTLDDKIIYFESPISIQKNTIKSSNSKS